MKLFDWLKHDPMGDFEDGADLNTRNKRRNIIVFSSLASVVMLIIAAAVVYNKSASRAEVTANEAKPIDFGAVIDTEFTAKDNQSALSAQQVTLTSLQKTIDDLAKAVKNHGDSNESFRQTVKQEQEAIAKGMASQMAYLEETLTEKMQSTPLPEQASTVTSDEVKRGRYLGQSQATPFQPTNYGALEKNGGNSNNSQPIGVQSGIDHVSLTWANDEATVRKRTIENYVPSGTVVTAVVTGGADANAGVNGQGDTTPIVFQTLNNGLLPNGKNSRLMDCTLTAAVYGEVSSSRGIARTNRISCIFEDDEIIDIPVEATVFNYGRNGIRGNTVIQNGQIVQMAGIASILGGAGTAATSLTQTTSTSALGTTSSVKPEDALLNMLGEGVQGAGKTLADYYIKLAEQYHPIIELNPGNVVNIVFLKGFPLDAVGIEEYETALAQQQSTATSPAAQIMETITNPLLSQLPPGARPAPGQAATPFGIPQ